MKQGHDGVVTLLNIFAVQRRIEESGGVKVGEGVGRQPAELSKQSLVQLDEVLDPSIYFGQWMDLCAAPYFPKLLRTAFEWATKALLMGPTCACLLSLA